jgi:hypothetical protein
MKIIAYREENVNKNSIKGYPYNIWLVLSEKAVLKNVQSML